jgi:hypothetical protein
MGDLRRLISYLLLGLLTVVGLGGAVLGIELAPSNVPLKQAVNNTLDAASYTQMLKESTAQGKETFSLVSQGPDRLGGYLQSGNKRTYVYVIGSEEYQSITVPANKIPKRLVFYKQASAGAQAEDPVRDYLKYALTATDVTKSGSTYTFTKTQQNQTGTFVYTVNGSYISEFSLTVAADSVHLVISAVGSSPPVKLPANAKVVTVPTSGG